MPACNECGLKLPTLTEAQVLDISLFICTECGHDQRDPIDPRPVMALPDDPTEDWGPVSEQEIKELERD